MDLCLSVSPPEVAESITEHYAKTFQQDSFIPAVPIGIIDHYYIIPLSVTLTLAEGHKVTLPFSDLDFDTGSQG